MAQWWKLHVKHTNTSLFLLLPPLKKRRRRDSWMDGQMSTFMLDACTHMLASTWREREIHAEALQWGKGLHSSHQKVCKRLVSSYLVGNRPMGNCSVLHLHTYLHYLVGPWTFLFACEWSLGLVCFVLRSYVVVLLWPVDFAFAPCFWQYARTIFCAVP